MWLNLSIVHTTILFFSNSFFKLFFPYALPILNSFATCITTATFGTVNIIFIFSFLATVINVNVFPLPVGAIINVFLLLEVNIFSISSGGKYLSNSITSFFSCNVFIIFSIYRVVLYLLKYPFLNNLSYSFILLFGIALTNNLSYFFTPSPIAIFFASS